MRYTFVIVALLLTGCSTVNQIANTCPGFRPYDPQMCKGQFFQQIPNFEYEAIVRRQRGEVW